MYRDFALVYDRLMADVDYEAWAMHYRGLMKLAGVEEGAVVTECACGTGSLSRHFAPHYRLTGLDASQEMLSVAAAKLRALGHSVPLVRQDMRRLSLHKQQDAILATCDGVNYLGDEASLRAFLAAAFRSLKPGGALIFDVSSRYKLSRILGQNTLSRLEGDVHYVWQNCWDEKRALLHMKLHIYHREADGRYALIVEEQSQRAWTQQELEEALGQAGFEGVAVYGGGKLLQPLDTDERLHLLARKPKH